jgi:hypothetical protein
MGRNEIMTNKVYIGSNDIISNTPYSITWAAAGAEASSAITCTAQVKNARGLETNAARALFGWVVDASSAVVAANAVVAGTDGTMFGLGYTSVTSVANYDSFVILTEADGDFDIKITKAGAATRYIKILLPDGQVSTGPVMTFGA